MIYKQADPISHSLLVNESAHVYGEQRIQSSTL